MAGIGNISELATKALVDRKTLALKAAGKTEDEVKKAIKGLRITPEDVADVFAALHTLTVDSREVVSIQGHGNYRLMDRKATKARNPQTGKQFDVDASFRLKFTPSKTLREDIATKKAAGKIPAAVARAPKAPAAAPTAPAPAPAAAPAQKSA